MSRCPLGLHRALIIKPLKMLPSDPVCVECDPVQQEKGIARGNCCERSVRMTEGSFASFVAWFSFMCVAITTFLSEFSFIRITTNSPLQMIKVISYHRTKTQQRGNDSMRTRCCITVMAPSREREGIRSTRPNPAKAVHMGMITCTKPWHPELFKSLCSKESDKQRHRQRERPTIKESDLIQQMWRDVMSGRSRYCMECLNEASAMLNGFNPCCFRTVIGTGPPRPVLGAKSHRSKRRTPQKRRMFARSIVKGARL